MTIEALNEIFTSDFNLDRIVAARQCWNSGARFSRLDRPRSSHGLFLLTDAPASYDLLDGTFLQVQPGDLLLLPKSARYISTFLSPPEKESHPLMINFHLTDDQGREILLGDRVIRLTREGSSLEDLFSAATGLYINTAPTRLKAKVFEIFGSLFPITDSDECALSYIGRHYTDDLSIPALAQRCALSESVYRRRFRALTGQSPVRYINGLKIEKACQLLQSGDMSPRQISDFLNFYSLPYFYKVFREFTGLTPNQYRDQRDAL